MNSKLLYISSLIIVITVFLLGTALNTICIAVFITRPSIRHKIPNILLLNQACIDTFTSFICCLLGSVEYMFRLHDEFNMELVYTHHAMLTASLWASLLSFTMIGFDRLCAVYKPLWHNVNIQMKHIKRGIALNWILSIILNLPYYVRLTQEFSKTAAHDVDLVTDEISYVLFWVNVLVYIATAVKARKKLRKNLSIKQSNQGTDINIAIQENIKKKREKKLMRTLMIMFLCFVLGFIVYGVSMLRSDENLFIVGEMLFAIASLINPIFTLTLKDFKIRNIGR